MKAQMKILIGYDGSDCANAALDDLRLAGLPQEVEAQVLAVAERWLPPPPPSAAEIIEKAEDVQVPADLLHVYTKDSEEAKKSLRLAEFACDRIKSLFPTWTITPHASCGSASAELIYQADQWQPDLIVVGSHGRTALGRFVLGSVSQRVLTEAKCSVRIARGRVEEADTPVRIIVGVDGSDASNLALKAVASRHWPKGSEITLVAVDDPLFPDYYGKLLPPLQQIIEEDKQQELVWAAKIAKGAARYFEKTDLKVTSVLREGDPKQELPKAAEEWRADCIFVGSVGFNSRFERFVLGSVSAAVAARAHCSVEVVRDKRRNAK
jgi:nucleotide-binding universal stress UspA family protein